MTNTEEIIVANDNVTWIVEHSSGTHVMHFKIYEKQMYGDEDRSVVAVGFLKWDHCLEINFERNLHFCGLKAALFFSEVYKAIFALGPKITNWDDVGLSEERGKKLVRNIVYAVLPSKKIPGASEAETERWIEDNWKKLSEMLE